MQLEKGKPVRNGRRLLTTEEEINLIDIYQGKSSGDPQAALTELIERNQGLIRKLAQKYSDEVNFPYDDAITEATIGFIAGCDRFDKTRGCKLGTHATNWILQNLIRKRATYANIIHIPCHVLEENRIYKNKWVSLSQKLGRDPTGAEVEEHLHISAEKAGQLDNLPINFLSLDTKINTEDGRGEYLIERICEPVPSLDAELFCTNFDLKAVADGMMKLAGSPKEQDVLLRRFGMEPYEGPQTLQVIADALGLSRERVRQIQVGAIYKIRKGLGLPAVLEVDPTATPEVKKEGKKRPSDLPTLMERNDSILFDSEHGMDTFNISDKYCLGISSVRQCIQEARRRRNGHC